MNKLLAIVALVLAVAVAVPALAADYPPYRQYDRERAANHPDRQDDRIEARHLDRQADRIERRYDRRADHAEALGNGHRADHLRAKGERIARHLDRKADRIEARMDRRGERFDRHFEHRKGQPKAYRHHDRHDHVYGPPPYAPWCGERLALRLDGLGIFWSHRH